MVELWTSDFYNSWPPYKHSREWLGPHEMIPIHIQNVSFNTIMTIY